MRKLIVLAVMIFLVASLGAQEKVMLPLTGWKYPNGNNNKHATGDSVASAGIDTVFIGLLGRGNLAPEAINIHVFGKGVGGTVDSLRVAYAVGAGGDFYTAVGSATIEIASMTTSGSGATRTLVFDTNGAATALNTQAAVFPHGPSLRLIIDQPTNDSETISYRIRAWGIYTK